MQVVRRVISVAPILAEGPYTNNEGPGVIHSIHTLVSWVFHSIHNFRTFLASRPRKGPPSRGKDKRPVLLPNPAPETVQRALFGELGVGVRFDTPRRAPV